MSGTTTLNIYNLKRSLKKTSLDDTFVTLLIEIIIRNRHYHPLNLALNKSEKERINHVYSISDSKTLQLIKIQSFKRLSEERTHAWAKALRKWTSWAIYWRNVSILRLPAAKDTAKGLYIEKRHSLLNLIHSFPARASSEWLAAEMVGGIDIAEEKAAADRETEEDFLLPNSRERIGAGARGDRRRASELLMEKRMRIKKKIRFSL